MQEYFAMEYRSNVRIITKHGFTSMHGVTSTHFQPERRALCGLSWQADIGGI